MKHLDLFSGIGGFSLAADRVWPNVEHTFVEIDPFCQAVLNKHWPKAHIHDDIRTFTNTQYNGFDGAKNAQGSRKGKNGYAEGQKELRQPERGNTLRPSVDLLTGGFPCQPFSQAGRRKGTADDRHLWPEMLRVIKEFKPTWVIGENVAGIVNMVLEQTCLDLEAEGYEVQPIIIPAVAVNAPHRRDRVWIVAHSGRSSTGSQEEPERSSSDAPGWSWERNWVEVAARFCGVFNGLSTGLDKTMSDGIYSKYAKTLNEISGQDLPHLWHHIQSEAFQWKAGRFDAVQNKDYLFTVLWQHTHRADGQDDLPFESAEVQEAYLRNVWHTDEAGCPPQGWRYNEQYAQEHRDALSSMSHEVALATEEVWRAYNKDRNPRLKALGNAIVPAVAEEIMKSIKGTMAEKALLT